MTIAPKEKPSTFAVYEYYRDEVFGDSEQPVKILRFRYGWLPVEILFETIQNLENKTDKVYKLYRYNNLYNPNSRTAYRVGDDYMDYNELHDTLGVYNLLS